MSRKHQLFVYSIITIAMLLWGMTFIWYKEALTVFRPISLVFIRLAIAAPLLLLFSLMLRKLQKINKSDIPVFLLVALFEPFLYFVGEGFGMDMVSSTTGAIIVATIPLFTPLAAYFFHREKLSAMNLVGIFISLLGVILVISGETDFSGTTVFGVLLMFLAVFSAVGYSVMVKKLAHAYNSFTIVSWQTVLGMMYFIPLFVIFEWNRIAEVKFTLSLLIPVVKLAVFGSALAFLFFTYSIKRLGMTRTAVFSNLIPVFTTLFAWAILQEKISALKLAGMAIVITGLLMSQYNFTKPAAN